MNTCLLITFAGLASLTTSALQASSPFPPPLPRYHFTRGETLRYLIQRDPYFANPEEAPELVNSDAPYRAPSVERLTERVLAVSEDGTATLLLTLTPEPGFEDDDQPQAAVSRTVTVAASGKVLSVSGAALGSSPAESDLLRGLALLTSGATPRKDGLAVDTQRRPVVVTETKSAGHDGTLQQTTTVAETDRLVFDCRRGALVRGTCTRTIAATLVMTGRGRRGSDDFGHVIPNTSVVQTLTIEAQGR